MEDFDVNKLIRCALMLAVSLMIAFSAFAIPVTYNFGTGSGVSSSWQPTSGASNSSTGVTIGYPVILNSGSLQITGIGGLVFCDQGVTAFTCGTSTGLTTSTAYGLGIGNGRIDATSEELIFTVTDPANWIVSLTDFSVTGFGSSSLTEQLRYLLNPGSSVVISAPGTNVALDTYSVNSSPFTTLTFSAPAGNYSLAEVTFNITRNNTSTPVPEPATILFLGSGIIGIGLASWRRKK